MMNLYTADKVAKFENDERIRAASHARMVKELRQQQHAQTAATNEAQTQPGLLRRLVLNFGRH